MAFGIIAYLVILAISIAVSYYMRPDPDEPSAPSLEDIDLPTCAQGTRYAVIFGRPPRTKANMILSTFNFRSGGIDKKGTIVAHYYYLGVHFGLCHGYVDGVTQIWAEDTCVWPTLLDEGAFANDGEILASINARHIWGEVYTGPSATVDILYGHNDQAQNATLKAYQDGDDTPTYRGITSLVFNTDAYWGIQYMLPAISVVMKRTEQHHDGSQMWYINKAKIGLYYSLNIVQCLRECLVSTIFGRGISEDLIDTTSFESAADTCYAEGIGLCYRLVPSQRAVGEFITVLESIMDGMLFFDHSVAKYKLKLIRDDYDVDTLTTYTEDDFSIEAFTKPTVAQTPSETIIKYTDFTSARRATSKDDDIAIMELQSDSPVSQMFDWPMIVDLTLAAMLAAREQDHASRMPAFLRLASTRSMYAIQRGDVFKISHPKLTLGGITTMTVRAVGIDRGRLEDGTLYIDVTEEVFDTVEVTQSYSSSSASSGLTVTEITSSSESIAFSRDAAVVAIINENVA